MRILQVNSASQLGGGETHVIELVRELRSRGHEVRTAGREGGPLEPDFAWRFRNAFDLLTARELRRTLKQHAFDVIHAHVARDYPLVTAAAWKVPVKVVLTRHLLYPVRTTPLYRRVDGWIAPTQQILSTLSALQPRSAVVIPNWVDLQKFPFQPHALHNPVTLGILGQISPHKGHDDAVEAVRLLGNDYKLLIAGKGDASYQEQLAERAAKLPVDFLGFVSLPEFFKRIDILLVPSWEEPFGIVLLEAMASGIPVISTAAGGPLDIIQPEASGLLVPPKDPAALADAVVAMLRIRDDVVAGARKRVEDHFDIKAVIPKVERFYESLPEPRR
jgi:glycosyltransferase involved in cell wall biosynthesis